MCNAGSTADYLFCATRSGDIVKLYVDFLADDGSKTASVVATAVKKAAAKKGVNAAKFTGGTSLIDFQLEMLKIDIFRKIAPCNFLFLQVSNLRHMFMLKTI